MFFSQPADHNPKRVSHRSIQVLDRRASILYTVPMADVFFVPQDSKRLILCERFNAKIPWESCRFASCANCRFVHADTTQSSFQAIHVNYAWSAASVIPYERHPPGMVVQVREPASANSTLIDHVPSERILKTRCVFDDPARPPSHCAHFYYGRECHLGAQCDFAHVAFINPTATPWERAPAPSTLGRGKQEQMMSFPSLDFPGCTESAASTPQVNSKHLNPESLCHSSAEEFQFPSRSVMARDQPILLSSLTQQEVAFLLHPDAGSVSLAEQSCPLGHTPTSTSSKSDTISSTEILGSPGVRMWRYDPYKAKRVFSA